MLCLFNIKTQRKREQKVDIFIHLIEKLDNSTYGKYTETANYITSTVFQWHLCQ